MASINGIFVTLFICVYRHEQVNIYSAFLRPLTESHNGSVQHYILGDFRELEEKYHKIKDIDK